MKPNALLFTVLLLPAYVAAAEDVMTFAVNEYFGIEYVNEPVSFDVTFDEPVHADRIHLDPGPWQVEVLEGTKQKVKRARVWTLVSFPHEEREVEDPKSKEKVTRRVPMPAEKRHVLYTVKVGDHKASSTSDVSPTVEWPAHGAEPLFQVIELRNTVLRAKVCAANTASKSGYSAFDVPGPVVSVSRLGKEWIGSGYLDTIHRVTKVESTVASGPVYAQVTTTYHFDNGTQYKADVRLFAGKPYVKLVEDFNVGGASKFVFNYDDWFVDSFFYPGDARLHHWESITDPNPCGDFIKIEGSKALARLVIWSQFNYFRGKQETIALKSPDAAALMRAYEASVERYKEQLAENQQRQANYDAELKRYEDQMAAYEKLLAEHKADPKKVKKPRKPRAPKKPKLRNVREPQKPEYQEIDYTLAGAPIRTTNHVTPGGDATAVGAFYCRPDRWTRAKVNHVDLYMRSEVPGDTPEARMTRGVVGLKGAKQRIAMEAWLTEGHREWAIFAVRAGDDNWLAKAHVREGVWPLDRINRLPLLWNSDGKPLRPEDAKPRGNVGGNAHTVLLGTRGRAGLQNYNGSNGNIRGRKPKSSGVQAKPSPVDIDEHYSAMVDKAMSAYLAQDDSAYPSIRAMLPWTDPEALNPFYQGMENMNFNADLYRYVAAYGVDLANWGHPDAARFVTHGEKSLDMALDRYVYPQSGCWEESHGYAGHTIGVVGPLAVALKNSPGRKNFLDDPRLARMLEFFMYVHSPVDKDFGTRVVPPVGDHGLKRAGPGSRFGGHIKLFTDSKNPEVQRIVRQLAWMIQEDGGSVPDGVKPEKAELGSRWLQGYGAVMRARAAEQRESFIVLRAGQSWGHHHADKGSLWGWFRNVAFFGDAAWGSPPGGTYWNAYKQGPASGTQIEFVGINNWTLPCKFPAPWINDDEYADAFDYANARSLYPYNVDVDLSKSTAVATRNAYDRQVLFVHPDVMIVRDNVEAAMPTVWRMHSYQPDGTTTDGPTATLQSEHGVTGRLHMTYPDGVKYDIIERDNLNDKYKDDEGNPLPMDQRPKFGSSVVLKWDMPQNTSATWVFAAHGDGEAKAVSKRLDEHGRVTQVKLADGTEIVALMNIEPFRYEGHGVTFEGTVGLVINRDGKTQTHAIRAKTLEVK